MNSYEKQYSVKEAAHLLGFSTDTILRLIRKGFLKAWKLPAIPNRRKRVHESWRIAESEVMAFMKRNAA